MAATSAEEPSAAPPVPVAAPAAAATPPKSILEPLLAAPRPPIKPHRAAFAGKKFAVAGVLLVHETPTHTFHLMHEDLELILDKCFAGAKLQNSVNSATDEVLIGETDREPDYASSKKALAIAEQTAASEAHTRGKELLVIPFSTWVNQMGLKWAVRRHAAVAHYGEPGPKNKKYIPPGPGRTRASMLPRTLVYTTGYKGSAKNQYCLLVTPPEEDPEGPGQYIGLTYVPALNWY